MKTDTIAQEEEQTLTKRPKGFRTLQLIDHWRSQHNPLRGLTINYAARLIEDGYRGAYADLQWLYSVVETCYPPLRAVKHRIRNSVLKLDWNIKVPEELPKGDEKLAEDQRLKLREEYDRIQNFRGALKHLLSAEFRGYAHLEKFWEKDESGVWHITGLNPVPQWHWVRDGILGDWEFNEDSRSGAWKGAPIHAENFVLREIEDPIDRIGLICFIRANLGEKDWAGFIEKFGIPAIFFIEPQFAENSPDADYFRKVAEQIAADAAGSLPHGTEVETIEPKSMSGDAFEGYLKHQAEQTVLAGTNSLLTMLTATGSGSLAGGAHQDTFDDLAASLAMDISEDLQRDIDQQVLNRFFPGKPHYAYFELAKEDQQDAKDVVTVAKIAKDAGLEVDAEELSEKAGYTFTKAEAAEPDDEKSKDRNPKSEEEAEIEAAKNREGSENNYIAERAFLQPASAQINEALASDFQEVRNRLEEAMQEEDEGKARLLLDAFVADLAEVYNHARASGGAEQALMDTLASAVANGFGDAQPQLPSDRRETP